MKAWMASVGRFGIAIIAGSALVASAPAGVIYWEEDFEGYSVNDDIRNTGGWGTVSFVRTHVEQDASDPVNPSKFVRFEEPDSTNRAISRPLAEAVTGDVRITMDLFNIGTNNQIQLWFGGDSAEGSGTVRLYWIATGRIGIWAQGAGVTQVNQFFDDAYDMDAWYRVFLDLSYSEADPAESVYTLQVYELQDAAQGTLGSRVAHAVDAPAAGMKTLTGLSVFSSGGAFTNFKMDNISVIPEPATAGLLLAGLVAALAFRRR